MVKIIDTATSYPQNNQKQCIVLKSVVQRYLEGIVKLVTTVVLNGIPITPAGTGTVRNARHL